MVRGLNEDSCFKTPCSEIINGPRPGLGPEPIMGLFSRSSLVNTLENWLFKISDFGGLSQMGSSLTISHFRRIRFFISDFS